MELSGNPNNFNNIVIYYGVTPVKMTKKQSRLILLKMNKEDALMSLGKNIILIISLKAVNDFLTKNDYLSIIRGHEAQLEGFKMHHWDEGVDFPSVITIFSAPNYCDVYNNKGAMIKFNNNMVNIQQFNYTPHPFMLPDMQNLFHWSLPFVSEKSR
jgi:hypothetical protein